MTYESEIDKLAYARGREDAIQEILDGLMEEFPTTPPIYPGELREFFKNKYGVQPKN